MPERVDLLTIFWTEKAYLNKGLKVPKQVTAHIEK
jgi:hypothetical protein